jgi:two-component system nitrogen regulation response regulator GlnG/two-component system response regulator HydG
MQRRALPGEDMPGVREHVFGEADAHGIVGESYFAWLLRVAIWQAGIAESHVLIFGESGAGKEMTAAGVHAWSTRAKGPFDSINAATFSPALIAHALFGNVKNQPNVGMPESLGLVGRTEGGTLFVDEIGEASPDLHANLLRVLDKGGEYQRIGENHTRRANVLTIAATNRAESALKPDLPKRFPVHIVVPPLRVRREDIPLIVRRLVLERARLEVAGGKQAFAQRFIARAQSGESGQSGQKERERDEVRISPALVTELVRREHPLNVRDVEALVVAAMMASPRTERGEDVIVAPHDWKAAVDATKERAETVKRKDPEKGELLAALRKHGGSLTEAGKDFGFNRFKVRRLMNDLEITDEECRTQ